MYVMSGYTKSRCEGIYRVATGMIFTVAGDCRRVGGVTFGAPEDWEWVSCTIQFCKLVTGRYVILYHSHIEYRV